MKKVTIHSDGTGAGTVILDEDGKQLTGISSAAIFINAGDVNDCTLEIKLVQTSVEANVTSVEGKCPCCEKTLEHKCEAVLGKQPDGEIVELEIVNLNFTSNMVHKRVDPAGIEVLLASGTLKVRKPT